MYMFADPKQNLDHLHFPASGTVVDIGAGSGHYAFLLADRLREHHGKVVAVDIQKEMLVKIKTEMIRRNVENIETVWGDAEEMRGTELKDDFADAAIVSNLLFQLSERDVFAQELFRILKKGGEVLAVDWSDAYAGMGPSPDLVISAVSAEKLFERHGFSVTDRFNAGDHHWGRIFKRST